MKHATTGLLTGLALAALAMPALAQTRPGYTLSRTPSHGKPGTVIHIEGGGCAYEGKPYDYARVYFYARGEGHLPPPAQGKYDVAGDGSFSGDLEVPHDVPGGPYRLSAECYASDMAYHVADLDFTVDGLSPTPTPSRRTPTPSPRPTPTRTATPKPSTTRTPTPRPTPSRTTVRALPSATRLLTTPSPSAVASGRPADPKDGPPGALVMAAAVLIAANGFGIRATGRRA